MFVRCGFVVGFVPIGCCVDAVVCGWLVFGVCIDSLDYCMFVLWYYVDVLLGVLVHLYFGSNLTCWLVLGLVDDCCSGLGWLVLGRSDC